MPATSPDRIANTNIKTAVMAPGPLSSSSGDLPISNETIMMPIRIAATSFRPRKMPRSFS